MNILSLFDGMSCGRLALERSGFKIDKYYASEISQAKIKASKNYFPDNIYIGDVTKVSGRDYYPDILIGGSPCQGFSIMGDRLNFDDPRSALIMDFFRILEETEPKYFLLENVPMDKQCEIEISRRLGVLPVKINSSLVSAQNRKRIYWTNIPGSGADLFSDEIEQPKDKGILLKDVIGYGNIIVHNIYGGFNENKCRIFTEKSPTLRTASGGGHIPSVFYGTPEEAIKMDLSDLRNCVRLLTPTECCRLQTVPDDFFDGSGLSDNQQYSCLGDGWTVDIICHILKGIN